jgi:hypothetical protein
VLRQQRKGDVMTSFGRSARSAVCYKAGSPVIWPTYARVVPRNTLNQSLKRGGNFIEKECRIDRHDVFWSLRSQRRLL